MFSWRHVRHVGGVNNIESAILEEYINPLGIELLCNAKTFFCFNGCWSHERTHSIGETTRHFSKRVREARCFCVEQNYEQRGMRQSACVASVSVGFVHFTLLHIQKRKTKSHGHLNVWRHWPIQMLGVCLRSGGSNWSAHKTTVCYLRNNGPRLFTNVQNAVTESF